MICEKPLAVGSAEANKLIDAASGASRVATGSRPPRTIIGASTRTGHKAVEHYSFGPPRKPAAQAKWEGYVNTPFTQERTPAVTAPDGAIYKVPLADVLRSAGHKV